MSRNPQSNYSFQNVAATMGGRFGGQYITNDTVDTYTLPWGGVATVRLLPTRMPSDPAEPGVRLSPFRYNQDVNAIGDWLRCYVGVRNFGAGPDGNGVSFIVHDPTDPTAPPKEESPPYVLFNAIDRAVRAGQEMPGWAALLRGGQNKGAQLFRPKPIYLANPLIMQHKEQIYNPPQGWVDSKPRVMIMSDSAGQALLNLANGIREDADPHDTDWTRVSKCGDLVGLGPGQGQYVTFYKSTEGDPRTRRANMAQGGVQMANFGAAQAGGGGGGNTGFASYCAYAEPAFQGQSADFSHLAPQIAARAIQWDQVLNFPSFDQQAMWLADKFDPAVICYAFQDYQEWIPPRVKAAYVQRTTHAGHMLPAGGFVGGYQMPMPQTQMPVPPVGMHPQAAQWNAVPPQATAGQAYMQTAVANVAAMAALQTQQAPVVPHGTAPPMEAVPFLVDALAPDPAVVAAQQLAAQQAAAQQAALQQQQQYAQQTAAPAAWGTAPQTQPAVQQSSAMAGMAASGIPVAVTQATVAASNVAQQPAAGFAMPTGVAPVVAAAAPQQMTRSQAALLAAQQAAQVQ